MARYRRRADIIADILHVAKTDCRKTRIMYLANLSYALMSKYLDEALSIGFISIESNKYRITEKGQSFLDKYRNFQNRYSTIEKALHNMKLEMETLEQMCHNNVKADYGCNGAANWKDFIKSNGKKTKPE